MGLWQKALEICGVREKDISDPIQAALAEMSSEKMLRTLDVELGKTRQIGINHKEHVAHLVNIYTYISGQRVAIPPNTAQKYLDYIQKYG